MAEFDAPFAAIDDRPTARDAYRISMGALRRNNLSGWWNGKGISEYPPDIDNVKTRPWPRYYTGFPAYEWKSSWQAYCNFLDDVAQLCFAKPDGFVDLAEATPQNWTPTELHQAAFGQDSWPDLGPHSSLQQKAWTLLRDTLLELNWLPMHDSMVYFSGLGEPSDYYYHGASQDTPSWAGRVDEAIANMANQGGWNSSLFGQMLTGHRNADNEYGAHAYCQRRVFLESGDDYWWPSDSWEPTLIIEKLFLELEWINPYYRADDDTWQNDVWGSISFDIYLNDKKIKTDPVTIDIYDDNSVHGPLMVECNLYEDGDLYTHRFTSYNNWELRLTSPSPYDDFTGRNIQQPAPYPPYRTYSRAERSSRPRIKPWAKCAWSEYTP